MKHLSLLFLIPGLLWAQRQGPHVVTKYVDIEGKTEIGLMTMAEFNERHKIVRQEQHVYMQAVKAAETDWSKQNAISFPRIFNKPEFSRLRIYTREEEAMKQMRKLQEAEANRQAIRERNEKNSEQGNRGGRRGHRNYGGNRSSKTDMEKLYKRQREARGKAVTLVQDKMEELMGTLNSAHIGRLKPEDVLSFGQPNRR